MLGILASPIITTNFRDTTYMRGVQFRMFFGFRGELLGGLPVRQFVLSFPFELRFLMARDTKLMGLVLAIVNKSIARLYGKRVRKLGQQIHMPFGELKYPRCFAIEGYLLHANTFCQEKESYKLRRLIEYVARPPFANERIALGPSGDVTMKLKKSFNDGTTHIVFTQLEFIEKLSALVPKPRVHLIRYAGAFARHAKIRPDVLVKARMGEEAAATEKDKSTPAPESKTPSEKSRNWARLLKKVFNIDVESCHACGGKNVKIVAAVLLIDS